MRLTANISDGAILNVFKRVPDFAEGRSYSRDSAGDHSLDRKPTWKRLKHLDKPTKSHRHQFRACKRAKESIARENERFGAIGQRRQHVEIEGVRGVQATGGSEQIAEEIWIWWRAEGQPGPDRVGNLGIPVGTWPARTIDVLKANLHAAGREVNTLAVIRVKSDWLT
jgi:hypothetical protein